MIDLQLQALELLGRAKLAAQAGERGQASRAPSVASLVSQRLAASQSLGISKELLGFLDFYLGSLLGFRLLAFIY